jgi:MYXO-CTERM domain-containing protein
VIACLLSHALLNSAGTGTDILPAMSRVLLAILLLGSGVAQATTYQVGPTRSWTQITQAMGTAAPGDVIEVDGNATYSSVRWTKSGTAAQPIRIVGVAAGGMRPRIQGGTNSVEIQADHVVMEGFDISGGTSRCFFQHGDQNTLRDSIVHDCPAQGILGADQDSGSFLLEYVEVHHCGGGDRDHQVYMATDEVAHPGSVFRMQYCYIHDANGGNSVKSRAERNEIYFNWIEGAQYHELELAGPDPGGAPSGWSVDLKREDSDIVGNVLRKTSTSFVARIGGDATGWSKGRYRFVNNTIITAPGSGPVFRLFDELESVEMHNNIIVTAGSGGPNVMRAVAAEFSWVNGVNVAGSNNWVMTGATNVPTQWTGTITGASPGLTNLTGDVRPVAGSPVIGAGNVTLSGPAGFAFPNPLWPPGFHPPLRSLIATGSASARPSGASIDIGAFAFGAPATGTGGTGAGAGGRGGAGGSGAGGAGRGGTSGANTGGAGGTATGAGGSPTNTGGGGASGANTGGGQAASGGCSCDVTGGGSPPALLVFALLTAVLLRRRRRRSPRRY